MEVPRLAYTTATAMQDLSHIYDLPQLVATPDPESTEQGQGSNPHPHGVNITSFTHGATMETPQ